jgi:4-nitrophenyl phosphatase
MTFSNYSRILFMQNFTNIRALIIDMDGVLWHGDQPLPGLKELFQLLREKQLPFILATNNAGMTQDEYVKKLTRMGVTVAHDEILTSSMATALYLAHHYYPSATRVFVIGAEGVRRPLLEKGFTLTSLYEVNTLETPNVGADIVVCGLDKEISWDKLATATLNIRAGAKFVGTNADVTLPTERGITHGNGAIIAAIKAATDVEPVIVGKPEPIMYQQAINLLGIDASEVIAVGDRMNTDILGAVNAGIRSVLVLTGISTREEVASLDYAPTWIMEDIQELTQKLTAL